MKLLNKNYKDCLLNITLRELYKQKQKVNNSKKYTKEEKILIMKGLDMAINISWDTIPVIIK